jgi:hypothetical protein
MNKWIILRLTCLLIVLLALIVQTSCLTSLTTTEVENEIYVLVNDLRQQLGLNVLVRDSNLDELARQSSASKFSDDVEQSTELRYLLHNSWWVTYSGGSPKLGKGTAQKQVDYCLETPELREVMLRSEARATGVGVAIVGNAVYYTQVFDVLSAASGNGEPLKLYENAQAIDPSWAQLKQFLVMDNTDDQPYIPGVFVCADFAAMLHNRAEMAGIKTGYVSIDFTAGPAHALNAFNTTDRGLVYIDCTGQGFQDVTSGDSLDSPSSVVDYDKVAYAGVGLDYGLIPLDKANSFDYAFYEQWEQQWAEYEQKISLYNSGTLSFKERQALKRELEALRATLGTYHWEPLGVVTDLYIHW